MRITPRHTARRTQGDRFVQRQPIEVQTLYAELLEQLAAYEAARAIGHLAGSFVTKHVKGHEYYYFQHVAPGGLKQQTYLGRRDQALDELAARFADGREAGRAQQESIERLGALLRAGGAMIADAPSARVLRGLADAGVFHAGGVLVGTHAFIVLGNVLGMRWRSSLRTQDIDIAAQGGLDVALPVGAIDVPSAIESLEMGFLPVPGLDRTSPSTAYKVRGQSLRVDLLTPAVRTGGKPVRVPRFGAAAQPLRFLDYLVQNPLQAAVVNGGVVAVAVPDPARFALHKLIVAAERPAAQQTKREKDIAQAAQLIEVLAQDRPGDLGVAWEALAQRGPSWIRRVRESLPALERSSPQAAEHVRALVG